MLATFDRLAAQRDRLASSPPTPNPVTSAMEIDPALLDEKLVVAPAGPAPAATKSKKNRLREVKKLVEQTRSAIDASDFERDMGPIKVEKVWGPAGKQIKFARVRFTALDPLPDIITDYLVVSK